MSADPGVSMSSQIGHRSLNLRPEWLQNLRQRVTGLRVLLGGLRGEKGGETCQEGGH